MVLCISAHPFLFSWLWEYAACFYHCRLGHKDQVPASISDKTSYRKISWSLEAVRLEIIASRWNTNRAEHGQLGFTQPFKHTFGTQVIHVWPWNKFFTPCLLTQTREFSTLWIANKGKQIHTNMINAILLQTRWVATGHVALVAITGNVEPVPYHAVKSLQLEHRT